MYIEKLKKEIASKLIRFCEITEKQEEIEKTLELSDDVLLCADPEDEDYEGWECDIEEWQELERERTIVRNSLVSAFTQATHYPIFSLSDKKMCDLISDIARIFHQDDKSSEKAINDLLDEIDLTEREDRIKRSRLIEPLFLDCPGELWLEQMYRQVIRCFVMGAFFASCVLCRAICEIALKKYLKKKMPSGSFEGKLFPVLLNDIAEKWKLLKPSTISMGRDINSTANELMHEGELKHQDKRRPRKVDEKIAFELIQSMQAFLKEVFANDKK